MNSKPLTAAAESDHDEHQIYPVSFQGRVQATRCPPTLPPISLELNRKVSPTLSFDCEVMFGALIPPLLPLSLRDHTENMMWRKIENSNGKIWQVDSPNPTGTTSETCELGMSTVPTIDKISFVFVGNSSGRAFPSDRRIATLSPYIHTLVDLLKSVFLFVIVISVHQIQNGGHQEKDAGAQDREG